MTDFTIYEFDRNLSASDRMLLTTEKPLLPYRVVLTGRLGDALARDTAIAKLESWGATVQHAVTYDTSVLLAVDPTKRTRKRNDAEGYHVAVKDEPAFVAWLHACLDDARALSLGATPPAPDSWFAGPEPVEPEFEDMITPLSDYTG